MTTLAVMERMWRKGTSPLQVGMQTCPVTLEVNMAFSQERGLTDGSKLGRKTKGVDLGRAEGQGMDMIKYAVQNSQRNTIRK